MPASGTAAALQPPLLHICAYSHQYQRMFIGPGLALSTSIHLNGAPIYQPPSVLCLCCSSTSSCEPPPASPPALSTLSMSLSANTSSSRQPPHQPLSVLPPPSHPPFFLTASSSSSLLLFRSSASERSFQHGGRSPSRTCLFLHQAESQVQFDPDPELVLSPSENRSPENYTSCPIISHCEVRWVLILRPASVLRAPQAMVQGPVTCPGPLYSGMHQQPPSTHEPCKCPDQYGGSKHQSTYWRCYSSGQSIPAEKIMKKPIPDYYGPEDHI
ncbi:protein transport protein Sec31A isoform X1 [Lates japonicus]|uniref:Protein transport protein Sec31A isoform X1 n=1 Tax=Lates japonicus TaxID=270547 RepID=A0AAD3MD34_LATJO|nr:protein transport protein Sec31A isoform X1 [Lates japonicus]